jgi:hypothetical protein
MLTLPQISIADIQALKDISKLPGAHDDALVLSAMEALVRYETLLFKAKEVIEAAPLATTTSTPTLTSPKRGKTRSNNTINYSLVQTSDIKRTLVTAGTFRDEQLLDIMIESGFTQSGKRAKIPFCRFLWDNPTAPKEDVGCTICVSIRIQLTRELIHIRTPSSFVGSISVSTTKRSSLTPHRSLSPHR